MPHLRISSLFTALAVLAAVPLRSQQPAGDTLQMPANGGGRVPAAVVLNNSGLADALRAEGVATIAVAADLNTSVAAITQLRNDPRVATVTVIGPAVTVADAARTARADGFWATSGVAPDIHSVVIASHAASTAPDARAIAAFIRGLRPVKHPMTQRGSLRDTTVAELDGGRVTIEYGRPSKRGRTIWGALVPWGHWWMPGADEATVITNAKDIHIGTLAVPAGEHTLYAMPADDQFTLIVNNAVGQFHTEYPANRDLGRVPMTKGPTREPMERMAFALTPAQGGLALKLIWDDREYAVVVTAGGAPALRTMPRARSAQDRRD